MKSFDEQVDALRRAADSTRRLIADPNGFSTYDPHQLLAYQERVLRWAHCAPEGAVLLSAPLQGWDGTPCSSRPPLGDAGGAWPEMRKARMKYGLNPFGGQKFDRDGKIVSV